MTKITVNNNEHEIDVSDEMPLLWLLRDHLSLTGTKYGCGKGLCGSCTVHVDGQPIRACQMTAAQVAGKKITTIEGLAGDQLHPLQQAWLDFDVPQCGYCQSGQLMSAAALLAENPKPDDNDIDTAMAGNICRCGTYNRIRAAIHRVASNSDKR